MALAATLLFTTLHIMAIRNEILARRLARLQMKLIRAGESDDDAAAEAAQ